jgi:pimeloyl-ACP methyl ester carboxylesterase
MRLSVWCSEEFPFNSKKNSSSAQAYSSGIKSNTFSVFPEEVCREWKVTKAKASENKAIKSNIPTLIISGEYDPDTPTQWAKQLANQLVNSYYLEFKGMSHTPSQNWDNNCAMDVAEAFFNNPLQSPGTACYTGLKEVAFKTKADN